jgi:threonine dehydrogenase-like Zn-dependent dehydrogenase
MNVIVAGAGPVGLMAATLLDAADPGLPGSLAAMNAQAVALFAQGDSGYVTDDVPSLLGRPARTFEQFATDYAQAFS